MCLACFTGRHSFVTAVLRSLNSRFMRQFEAQAPGYFARTINESIFFAAIWLVPGFRAPAVEKRLIIGCVDTGMRFPSTVTDTTPNDTVTILPFADVSGTETCNSTSLPWG